MLDSRIVDKVNSGVVYLYTTEKLKRLYERSHKLVYDNECSYYIGDRVLFFSIQEREPSRVTKL